MIQLKALDQLGNNKTPAQSRTGALYLAVAAGFEPAVGGYPTFAFEANTFGRSDTLPRTRIANSSAATQTSHTKPTHSQIRTQVLEEVCHELGAFGFEDAAADLHGVEDGGVADYVEGGAAGAGFGFVGSEDDVSDSGANQGAGAHGAGFEGDCEGAVGEAPAVATLGAGLGDGDDFGVAEGVVVGFAAVGAAAEDGAVGAVDDGSDGDVGRWCGTCEGDGFAHHGFGAHNAVLRGQCHRACSSSSSNPSSSAMRWSCSEAHQSVSSVMMLMICSLRPRSARMSKSPSA